MTATRTNNNEYAQRTVQFSFTKQQADSLFSKLKMQRGILSQTEIESLCQQFQLSKRELLQACVPIASLFSVAPISKFYVGAVAQGKNQLGETQFFFGANVEFSHQALSLVVHAEQSAINNAWLNGAQSIQKIAISDAPCGYCRQFMNELSTADSLEVLLPERDFNLHELLPYSFGPKDLGNEECLFSHKQSDKQLTDLPIDDAKLIQLALNAYVPYTGNFSAVKLTTFDEGDFYGSYAENAAYSPSLSPLQSALSQFYLAGLKFDNTTVKEIILLETAGAENQLEVTKSVLASFENPPAFQHCVAKLVKD